MHLADTTRMARVLPFRDAYVSGACSSVYLGGAMVRRQTKRLLKLRLM